MSKGGTFFLGLLTGIAVAVAAFFVIKNTSLSSEKLTMSSERGKVVDSESLYILSTKDNYHAIAISSDTDAEMYVLAKMLNIDPPLQSFYYVIGNKKSNFYDGYEIKTTKDTKFYHVGTYKHKTEDGHWRTIPAVMLLKEK